MKVLDATFLIDYLAGVDATAEFLVANEEVRFVFPAPAYAEVLVGEGNVPDGDVEEAKADLSGERSTRRTRRQRNWPGRSQTRSGLRGRSSPGWTDSLLPLGENSGRPWSPSMRI